MTSTEHGIESAFTRRETLVGWVGYSSHSRRGEEVNVWPSKPDFVQHIGYRPLRESRGQPVVEALCGRMAKNVASVVSDPVLPACPICAALLIRKLMDRFPRGLVIPDPVIEFAPPDALVHEEAHTA